MGKIFEKMILALLIYWQIGMIFMLWLLWDDYWNRTGLRRLEVVFLIVALALIWPNVVVLMLSK